MKFGSTRRLACAAARLNRAYPLAKIQKILIINLRGRNGFDVNREL